LSVFLPEDEGEPMSNTQSGISPVGPATWRKVAELLRTNRWEAAVEILRSLAETTGCCEVRITLGALLAERQQFFEAIQQWTSVIDDASARGQRDYLAAAFHNLAAVYRELGDLELARRFQQTALRYQDDCGPEELLHLTNDALAASRWDLAEALLQSASELAADDDPLHATLTATAGVTRALQGDVFTAVGLLRLAYRQHLAQGDEREAGCDLLNLAATFRRTGRLGLEMKCLSRAASHFEHAGASRSQAHALERQRQAEQLMALRGTNPHVN
jgi:tetratricopeptide (TPR) repeat protein